MRSKRKIPKEYNRWYRSGDRHLTKKQRKKKKAEKLRNKKLVKQYYWLAPREYTWGKPYIGRLEDWYDYSYIMWGWGKGWDKAFGKIYMEELGAAVKEAGQKDFSILETKEKYNEARLYCGGTTEKVHDIIRKYEVISGHICYYCGKEAPAIYDGYLLARCFDCYCKQVRRGEKWVKDPNYTPMTDEEILEEYNERIDDVPDENGEYHLPDKYKLTSFKDGETIEEIIDISDTTTEIRKWWNKHH